MARNISNILRTAFGATDVYNHSYYSSAISYNGGVRNMEIPISDDVFEIPLFVFKPFLETISMGDSSVDALVVPLKSIGRISGYKTVERCMQDILIENYIVSNLVVIEAQNGDETVRYYGTQGAVFDKDFLPVAMCAWQIKRIHSTETSPDGSTTDTVRYKFIRPILRVSPSVYLTKGDTMEKFIVNRLITFCAGHAFQCPHSSTISEMFDPGQDTLKARIEIDSSPYNIFAPDNPSISTSNKELLQVALDHIEEVLQ